MQVAARCMAISRLEYRGYGRARGPAALPPLPLGRPPTARIDFLGLEPVHMVKENRESGEHAV